jgi:photosystem II stability/assembly factor-like uncharacterized protein
VDSLLIFAMDRIRIARSTDGGASWTWQQLGGDQYTIGFANDHRTGYAMGAVAEGPYPGEWGATCYKTTDGGDTWVPTYTGIPGDVGATAVLNPQNVIVTAGNALIFRTTDGGKDWIPIHAPDTNTAFDGLAIQGERGFITGSHGLILRSDDTGKTWVDEPSGINGLSYPNLYTPIIYNDSLAAASADDEGIIIVRRSGSAGVAPQQQDSLSVGVYPNPSQQSVAFQFSLPEPQHVWLSFFDMNGRKVGEYFSGILQSAGSHTIAIDTRQYLSGQYTYDLITDKYYGTGKITVLH